MSNNTKDEESQSESGSETESEEETTNTQQFSIVKSSSKINESDNESESETDDESEEEEEKKSEPTSTQSTQKQSQSKMDESDDESDEEEGEEEGDEEEEEEEEEMTKKAEEKEEIPNNVSESKSLGGGKNGIAINKEDTDKAKENGAKVDDKKRIIDGEQHMKKHDSCFNEAVEKLTRGKRSFVMDKLEDVDERGVMVMQEKLKKQRRAEANIHLKKFDLIKATFKLVMKGIERSDTLERAIKKN